jgi:hypothetical protein
MDLKMTYGYLNGTWPTLRIYYESITIANGINHPTWFPLHNKPPDTLFA